MSSSHDEQMKDRMIGEALLALLEDQVAVSAAALIARLEEMAETEEETYRKIACQRALADVRSHSVRTNSSANYKQPRLVPDEQKH